MKNNGNMLEKKLVSLNNIDIKFKEFFIILEGYFGSYQNLCYNKNIEFGKEHHIFYFL